jgi:hypothetical protein
MEIEVHQNNILNIREQVVQRISQNLRSFYFAKHACIEINAVENNHTLREREIGESVPTLMNLYHVGGKLS